VRLETGRGGSPGRSLDCGRSYFSSSSVAASQHFPFFLPSFVLSRICWQGGQVADLSAIFADFGLMEEQLAE
jgi:hypothetical protein